MEQLSLGQQFPPQSATILQRHGLSWRPQKGGVSVVGTPKGARLTDLTRGQQNAAVPRAGDMGPPVSGAGSHILLGGPVLTPQDLEAALPIIPGHC